MLDIGPGAFKSSCLIFPHTDENNVYLIYLILSYGRRAKQRQWPRFGFNTLPNPDCHVTVWYILMAKGYWYNCWCPFTFTLKEVQFRGIFNALGYIFGLMVDILTLVEDNCMLKRVMCGHFDVTKGSVVHNLYAKKGL